jgi:hypothetical protein
MQRLIGSALPFRYFATLVLLGWLWRGNLGFIFVELFITSLAVEIIVK